MADTKLSALTELAATPASGDEVYIRDISEAAADESKRITMTNLLAFYDALTSTMTNKTIGAFTLTGQITGEIDGLIALFQRTTDAASNQVLRFGGGDRATPADNDEAYLTFELDDSTGAQVEMVRLTWKALDVTSTSKDSRPELQYYTANTLRELVFPAITADDTVAVLTLAQTLTNKTLTTPTIGDFSNSGHDHSNAAGGGAVQSASATASGVVELATAAETTTGTDTGRSVTPDGLAGSEYGERAVQIVVFERATDCATGDGKADFHIDSRLGGMNLVDVHAEVITSGTTGTMDIQIANVTQVVDMLSTKLTIDSGETGSDTAATAAVIDTLNDDVAENDMLRIDVDAIHTTAAKGLIITMGFRTP
ncbi:MAG: hypothetical protein ACE5Q6_09640 [Dehalococcoidia bacterium]